MIQAQSFLIKGICLNRGLWIVLKSNFQKTFYQGEKEIAGKPITASTASKVETELDKVVNSKKSHAMNYREMVMILKVRQVLPKWRMKRAADMLRVKIHTL